MGGHMRLLVTGVTGFIGSRLALEARRRGHAVVGCSRHAGEAAAELVSAGVEFIAGDVTDPAFARKVTSGISRICHLAAAWREATASPEYFERINVEGSLTLARAAAANGVSAFIYCSTIGVHPRVAPAPIREDSALEATNAYEISKVHAEESLRALAPSGPMRIGIIRPADAYGPGDLRLLKLFKSVGKGRFPLVGAGRGRRHMLYVDDLVAAFLAACEAEFVSGEVFIVAGPETCTLRELLERLAKLTGSSRFGMRVPTLPMKVAAALIEDLCRIAGRAPPLHRRSLDFYRTDVAYDITKAKRLLHWAPQVNLNEGLGRTLDWYRERHLL
jgi:nucleoside-diphosphate-sugar epimerase